MVSLLYVLSNCPVDLLVIWDAMLFVWRYCLRNEYEMNDALMQLLVQYAFQLQHKFAKGQIKLKTLFYQYMDSNYNDKTVLSLFLLW